MKSLLTDISLPFAVIFFALAILFLYVARQQDANARALIGDSNMVVARLTDKTTSTSSGSYKDGGFGDKGATTYTLHYEFAHPDSGQTMSSSSSVAKETWEAMQVGLYYQVLSSRQNPTLTSLFNGQEFIDGTQLAYQLMWGCGALGLACIAHRIVNSVHRIVRDRCGS